jgi:hypothetical protein
MLRSDEVFSILFVHIVSKKNITVTFLLFLVDPPWFNEWCFYQSCPCHLSSCLTDASSFLYILFSYFSVWCKTYTCINGNLLFA